MNTEAACHTQTETPSDFKNAAFATVHCLIGCAIGEFAGLAIGVSLQLGVTKTLVLAVVLAFISGMSLAVYSLRSRTPLSIAAAFKVVWLGEVISITVMEIAMNVADYAVGGMQAMSLAEPVFWLGYGAALVAGYIAAFPANYLLLKKHMKHCH